MFEVFNIILDKNYERLSRKQLREETEALEDHIRTLQSELDDRYFILHEKLMEEKK